MTKKQEEYEIVKYLMEKYDIICEGDSGKLYCKINNTYSLLYDNTINMYVVDAYLDNDEKYNRNKKGITIDILKSLTYIQQETIRDSIQNTIPLLNGVYYLNRTVKVLEPSNPTADELGRVDSHFRYYPIMNYYNLTQIPVKFDKNAKCPTIEKFLIDVFGAEQLELIYEWIGYLLLPTVKYQRAMILVGSGKNGKTTFLDMIIRFLGLDNVTQIPLQELDNRFEMVNLKGKYANIVADLPNRDLVDSGNAKRIVTDATLEGSIKNIQGRFSFYNRVKNLYSCNNFPRSKDQSLAFYRRWSLFICSSVFEGNKDINMLSKITTNEELSGLLNKAIEGVKRLEEKGGFPDTAEYVKSIWETKSNPVGDFIQKKCIRISDSEIKSIDFFNSFNEYRAAINKPLLNGKSIGYWLRQYGVVGHQRPDKDDVDKYGNPKWFTFYQDLEIKDDFLKLLPKRKKTKTFVDTFGGEHEN